jgi:hypothetical protein
MTEGQRDLTFEHRAEAGVRLRGRTDKSKRLKAFEIELSALGRKRTG